MNEVTNSEDNPILSKLSTPEKRNQEEVTTNPDISFFTMKYNKERIAKEIENWLKK